MNNMHNLFDESKIYQYLRVKKQFIINLEHQKLSFIMGYEGIVTPKYMYCFMVKILSVFILMRFQTTELII